MRIYWVVSPKKHSDLFIKTTQYRINEIDYLYDYLLCDLLAVLITCGLTKALVQIHSSDDKYLVVDSSSD